MEQSTSNGVAARHSSEPSTLPVMRPRGQRPHRCGRCGQQGHSATTCAAPARPRLEPRDPTKPRKGQSIPWGTVAPQIRAALNTHGVVEATAIARSLGLPPATVLSALKFSESKGEIVRAFRGVYALPAVARAIHEAVTAANASRAR